MSTAAGTSPTNPFDQFAYAPTVTGIAPTTGGTVGGTTVTITGTGFIGASGVRFGATAAGSYSVVSASSITAVSPSASAGTVDITVTTLAGTSSTSAFDKFTYGLSVTGISPSTGPAAGGTGVTISGSGFVTGATVSFGGTSSASVTVVSPTSITATSPAGSGTVDVTVTTTAGTSAKSADRFTYAPAAAAALGIVIDTGTGAPQLSCGGPISSNDTCSISGVGVGNGTNESGSVAYYVEFVAPNGNPVVFSNNNCVDRERDRSNANIH